MRSLLATVVVLAACKSGDKPPASTAGPGPGSGSAVAVTQVAPTADVPPVAPAPAGLDGQYVDDEHFADLGDGYRLYAGFVADSDHLPETFEVVLAKDGLLHSRVKGLAAIAPGFAIPEGGAWDNYEASVSREKWGSYKGIRLSLGLRAGEDIYSAQELAILYPVPSPVTAVDTWKPLWVGLGTEVASEMERCKTNIAVTFEIDGQTLVKRSADGCGKRTKKTVDRFPVPTLPAPPR